MLKDFEVKRLAVYFSGLFIISVGAVCFVKAGLGVAPFSAFALTFSVLTDVNYAVATFAFNCLIWACQCLIQGRIKWLNVLQLIIALVYSVFIRAILPFFADFQVTGLVDCLIVTVLGVLAMAIGVNLMVATDFIVLPSEGFVKALAEKMSQKFGTTKLVSDVSMTVLVASFSFLTLHAVPAIGLGTIITAFFTGNINNLFAYFFGPRLSAFLAN